MEYSQTHHEIQRADFLFKAGHGFLFSIPSLSRYYMNEHHSTLQEYQLTPHKSLDKIACKSCGQIRLPGYNTKVALVKKNKRKNALKTTCLACCRTMHSSGSSKKSLPKPIKEEKIIVPVHDVKKKKNKGKKNNLKALLNKSATTTTTSHNLGDFLSSL